MVLLIHIIALACISFVVGLFTLLYSSNTLKTSFGFLLLYTSGILFLSSFSITPQIMIFFGLGFFTILMIFYFNFHDYLIFNNTKEEKGETDV